MASEVSREQLGDVVPDIFEWPDAGVEADAGDDDSDDGGARDDATEGGTVDIFTRSSAFELDHRKKETKKARKGQQQTRSSASAPTSAATKLRPSVDIYNRLMWDVGVQREDYMIGYEDRFKGVREMPLLSWKREVEDEAFVSGYARGLALVWLTHDHRFPSIACSTSAASPTTSRSGTGTQSRLRYCAST